MDQKAKEMFLQYGCSHFFMSNDGVLEEYNRFQISPEQERLWRIESLQETIDKFRQTKDIAQFAHVFRLVSMLKDSDCFPQLLDLLTKTQNEVTPERFDRYYSVFVDGIHRLEKHGIDTEKILKEAEQRCGR